MKISVVIFFLLAAIVVHAQTNSFDGKTILVSLFEDNQLDSRDTLFFNKGMMQMASGIKFGFDEAEYKLKEKKDGLEISATNHSKKNGLMAWVLTQTDTTITGICIWTPWSRQPIHYTVEAKEIK